MQVFVSSKLNTPVHPDSIIWHTLNEQNFNLTFIQPPGPENPLGKVKFLFPNTFDVYLHDTPAKHLFTQKERGFSHGCIRLEEPMKLAQYLLAKQGMWKEKEINRILGMDKEVYMKLKKKYLFTLYTSPPGPIAKKMSTSERIFTVWIKNL